MKLLFDENLSRKLVLRLAELYPESAHVAEFGLLNSPDREIWEFAKAGNFVVVSTPERPHFSRDLTPRFSKSRSFFWISVSLVANGSNGNRVTVLPSHRGR